LQCWTRDQRFFEQVDGARVQALVDALARWIEHAGARGYPFLRALGETGGAQPAIAAAVLRRRPENQQPTAIGCRHGLDATPPGASPCGPAPGGAQIGRISGH
jgi:hypothetical protein